MHAGLFSATQTEAVGELARAGLRNAVRVNVAVKADEEAGPSGRFAGQKTPLSLEIGYQTCESTEKLANLLHFLKASLLSSETLTAWISCERDKIPLPLINRQLDYFITSKTAWLYLRFYKAPMLHEPQICEGHLLSCIHVCCAGTQGAKGHCLCTDMRLC